MENDIKNLPPLPDSQEFYNIVIMYHDNYEKIYDKEPYTSNINTIFNILNRNISLWKKDNPL